MPPFPNTRLSSEFLTAHLPLKVPPTKTSKQSGIRGEGDRVEGDCSLLNALLGVDEVRKASQGGGTDYMKSSGDMQNILSTEKCWATTTAYPRLKKPFLS